MSFSPATQANSQPEFVQSTPKRCSARLIFDHVMEAHELHSLRDSTLPRSLGKGHKEKKR